MCLLQELETCVRLKLNLTILVLNDNAYGMIRWKQNAAGFEKYVIIKPCMTTQLLLINNGFVCVCVCPLSDPYLLQCKSLGGRCGPLRSFSLSSRLFKQEVTETH